MENYKNVASYKKGDFVGEYITAANYKAVRTCIGFVVGYTHHGGTEMLLNKAGGDFSSSKVFDTKEQAERFINKHQSKYDEPLYFRCYMHEKYTKN